MRFRGFDSGEKVPYRIEVRSKVKQRNGEGRKRQKRMRKKRVGGRGGKRGIWVTRIRSSESSNQRTLLH